MCCLTKKSVFDKVFLVTIFRHWNYARVSEHMPGIRYRKGDAVDHERTAYT